VSACCDIVLLVRKLLLLLVFWSCLAAAIPAAAQFIQQRFLPANGARGTLGEPQLFPAVRIGSRTLRLSPGARIYDRSNRTIVHAQLPPGAEVLYSTDQTGDIQRMYILTDEELLRLRQAGRR
jgi:hypothetical protein